MRTRARLRLSMIAQFRAKVRLHQTGRPVTATPGPYLPRRTRAGHGLYPAAPGRVRFGDRPAAAPRATLRDPTRRGPAGSLSGRAS
jgi:hypothetical protein